MRSKAESPCLHQAVVEIRGIPFCEACAREQQAYFAIGELTRGKHSLPSKPLAEVLERMRRERADGTEGIAAEGHHRPSGVYETKPLALSNNS